MHYITLLCNRFNAFTKKIHHFSNGKKPLHLRDNKNTDKKTYQNLSFLVQLNLFQLKILW